MFERANFWLSRPMVTVYAIGAMAILSLSQSDLFGEVFAEPEIETPKLPPTHPDAEPVPLGFTEAEWDKYYLHYFFAWQDHYWDEFPVELTEVQEEILRAEKQELDERAFRLESEIENAESKSEWRQLKAEHQRLEAQSHAIGERLQERKAVINRNTLEEEWVYPLKK